MLKEGERLIIAAQAVALGYAMVTGNPSTPLGTGERELARIDDLPRENWLREA